MKKTRSLVVALALLTVAACTSSAPPPAPAGATQEDEIRRFGAILDYVAADYAAAVVDGKIADQGEYDEQIVFLKDAVALSAKLPPGKTDVAAGLARLQKQVADKAPAAEIARDARALRTQVLDEHGVVLAPTVPPSRERGAELFQQMCTTCHGTTGAGDGAAAVGMVPPPRSFHDAEVMADLSPTRAYNAMTDGIRGTAMPSFGAFSQSDRWALAFYVFGLQHTPEAVRRGEAAYQKSNRPVAATSTRLAAASDRDIVELGTRAGLSAAEARDLLAFLRADAPFRAGDAGAPLDRARKLLAAATTAYRAGDAGSARQHIGAAYLDGFEPQEGALRASPAR